MKKKLIVLFALLSLSTSVFAKGIYSGNVQIDVGYNFDELFSTPYNESVVKSSRVNWGIETWHTFKLPLFFEAGFMFDINFGYGATNITISPNNASIGFYGSLGPAFAFNLLSLVKFNFAIGPSFEISLADTKYTILNAGVGFGINFQTLFFPSSPVSPIFGYKFAFIGGEMFSNYYVDNITPTLVLKNDVYLGISFNW